MGIQTEALAKYVRWLQLRVYKCGDLKGPNKNSR
jgi:hypothetical protein